MQVTLGMICIWRTMRSPLPKRRRIAASSTTGFALFWDPLGWLPFPSTIGVLAEMVRGMCRWVGAAMVVRCGVGHEWMAVAGGEIRHGLRHTSALESRAHALLQYASPSAFSARLSGLWVSALCEEDQVHVFDAEVMVLST